MYINVSFLFCFLPTSSSTMLAAFDNLFAHAPVNPAAQVNMNVGGAIPKYIIGPILGKALGMTAARNINRGELVLSEPSIIELDIGPQSIYNPDVFFDPRKRHNGDSALSTRFNQLDPARQMLLTALHSRVRNRGTLGIVSTNAFERTKDVDGVEYCIIYVCDVISRVNHSCRPNAVVEWDATLGQATLFATMPITAGTEVTVDYISNVSTYLQRELDRRAELQKSYAFRCECAACGLPRRSNAVDDNLRLQTAVIRQQVQDIDPAQAVVDFSDRAQHRHRDLQILRTYTLNLEQLGARNGKLVEA